MGLENDYKQFTLPGADYYKLAKIDMPETIELRHMTVKEVNYFNSLAMNGDVDKFIDGVLMSCAKTKFNIKDVLSGDRVYLFYMLRALTLGNTYSFKSMCSNPDCMKVISSEIDLLTMDSKKYDAEAGYPISFRLPQSGKVIEFVLPTRGIEKSVEADVAKMKKDTPDFDPPEATFQLRRLIKTVDGDSDFIKVSDLCESMHIKDWVALKKRIEELSPGVDVDIIVTCPFCQTDNEEKFSVRPEEFFRF